MENLNVVNENYSAIPIPGEGSLLNSCFQENVQIWKEYKELLLKVKNELPESHHVCEKCGEVCADEHSLMTHCQENHPLRRPTKRHQCEPCVDSSDSLTEACQTVGSSFEEEQKIDSVPSTSNEEEEVGSQAKKKQLFECAVCTKKFNQRGNLTRHMRIHTNEKPYECKMCGDKFNQSTSLKTHVSTVHEKRRAHACPVCDFTCAQAGNLRQHMLVHTGERNFKCSLCDKSYSHANTLRTHMRTHTGEKPYKCNHCPVAFNCLSSLRGHAISFHTKEFPYKCPTCQKGFLTPSKMQKHTTTCGK